MRWAAPRTRRRRGSRRSFSCRCGARTRLVQASQSGSRAPRRGTWPRCKLSLIEPRSATPLPGQWGLDLLTSGRLLLQEMYCGVGSILWHPANPGLLYCGELSSLCAPLHLAPPCRGPFTRPFPSSFLCLRPAVMNARNLPRGPSLRVPPRGWVSDEGDRRQDHNGRSAHRWNNFAFAAYFGRLGGSKEL